MTYNEKPTARCYLIGEIGSLLVQCGEILLQQEYRIVGVLSPQAETRSWAVANNIPVQESLDEACSFLVKNQCDYLFSLANLTMLPARLLALPKICSVNYHDALLPNYKGLNATTWAIANQEKTHGISWHVITEKVDAGDIVLQAPISIDDDETAFSLNFKCYSTALNSFSEMLSKLANGPASFKHQESAKSSYYQKKMKPSNGGLLCWNQSAEQLDALVRSLDFGKYQNRVCLAKFKVAGQFFSVKRLTVLASVSGSEPGRYLGLNDNSLLVSTSTYDVALSGLRDTRMQETPASIIADWLIEQKQTKLPILREAEQKLISDSYVRCSGWEDFWYQRLSVIEHQQLPVARPSVIDAENSEASQLQCELPIASGVNDQQKLLTALAIFTSRLLDTGTVNLGICYRDQSTKAPELLGLFEDLRPLAIDIANTDTFVSSVECVTAELNSMFEKETFSIDVLSRLQPAKGIRYPFAVEAGADCSLELSQVEADVLVQIDAEKGRMTWTYCANQLEQSSVQLLFSQFQIFAQHLSAHPNVTLEQIPSIIPGSSYATLLERWNSTEFDSHLDGCIHEFVETQAEAQPHATAVVYEDQRMSYLELIKASETVAQRLKQEGVQSGELVAICVDRSIQMVVGLLAILKSGCAYVPFDPSYPANRLLFMLRDCGAKVVITESALYEQVTAMIDTSSGEDASKVVTTIVLEDCRQNVPKSPIKKAIQSTASNPSSLAYVLYTSGSTGKPKGVQVTHCSILNFLHSMQKTPGMARNDKLLAVTTYCFDISVLELFLPLVSGAECHILPTRHRADPDRLIAALNRSGATMMQATPTTWKMMFDHGWRNSRKVRILCGGEAVTSDLRKRFIETESQAWNLYGPTETTIWSTACAITEYNSSSIGTPIDNTQCYVVDSKNRLAPIGVPGELLIGGAGVTNGYLNRESLTQKNFIQNPFSDKRSSRLYRTGDLVRWSHQGGLDYLGRQDSQIKLHGYRIELSEIESVLMQHEAILDVAVVMTSSKMPRLVAFFVAKGSHYNAVDAGHESLTNYLKEKLPVYMIPGRFESLDVLPLTPNGKIDKNALQSFEFSTHTSAGPLSFDSIDEAHILSLWENVLGRKSIDVNEGFFAAGATSFDAVALASEIQRQAGIPFTPVLLFKYNTVRSITKYLQSQNTAGDSNGSQEQGQAIAPAADSISSNLLSERSVTQQEKGPSYLDQSIAIIGISCDFPDATDARQFWKNLEEGVESVQLLSDEDALSLGVPQDTVNKANYVPVNSWLDGKDSFDAEFFKISFGNAALMDPQFRLLMLNAWQAVEDAGYVSEDIRRSSVHMSCSSNLYQALSRGIDIHNPVTESTEEFMTWIMAQGGTIPSMISYQMGLQGPSVFVHSNCSSSLSAIAAASHSLQSFDVDYALVGAATITAAPNLGYLHQPGMNLSSDGHCRTFDSAADGMVEGEGAGVILLKRAEDAVRDRDNIYCLIRGVGVNNDGNDKAGFYAPSAQGQSSVIRQVLRKTQIDPETIGYVETHGTGTSLGDPIEVMALTDAFREFSDKKQFCALGSVKPNIGHLDTAAGLAGCIKVALSLHKKKFLPVINYKHPNPQINFDDSPFYVLVNEQTWQRSEQPKRAGLSSFGIGGTNTHAILEEFCPINATTTTEEDNQRCHYLFPLSAHKEDVLKTYAENLRRFLEEPDCQQYRIADIAFTLQVGRKPMKYRAAFLASTIDELVVVLNKFIQGTDDNAIFTSSVSGPESYVGTLEDDEDFQSLLTQWLRQGKLRKLAKFWTGGVQLDWKHMHKNSECRRVSLPAYPFSKQTYWYSTAQPAPAREGKRKTVAIHPLLHTNTSTFNQQSYGSTFDGSEFFLEDHKIGGNGQTARRVLPGVAYLEMARAAFEQASSSTAQSRVIELQNVIWMKPLEIDSKKHVEITFTHTDEISTSDKVDFEVTSKEEETSILHCQGQVLSWHNPENEVLDIDNLTTATASEEMDTKAIYAAFSRMGLEYGRAHRGLTSVTRGSNQVLARVKLHKHILSSIEDYVAHPGIVDSALQAALCLTLDVSDSANQPPLPFSLDSCRLLRSCTTDMYVWVRYTEDYQDNDRITKLDIDVCDSAGAICIQLKGLTSRPHTRTPNEKQEPVSFDRLLASPNWQECPELNDKQYNNVVSTDQKFGSCLILLCELPGISGTDLTDLDSSVECAVLHANGKQLTERYTQYCICVFEHLQKIVKSKPRQKVLVQIVVPKSDVGYQLAGLSGMLKTVNIENPRVFGQLLIVPESHDVGALKEQLHKVRQSSYRTVMQLDEGKWFTQSWAVSVKNDQSSASVFRHDGVYVITGGLGALGLKFAQEIIHRTSRASLILTGRSKQDARITAIVDELCDDKHAVTYVQMNLADSTDVMQVLDSIHERTGRISGIIHSAGMIQDSFILSKTAAEFEQVLLPKVNGCWNLDAASANFELDFLVLFSSVSSVFGNIGQSDYSCANGFMDHFAVLRNAQVKKGLRTGHTLAINWPLWKDGGMSVDHALIESVRRETGMVPMSDATGMTMFHHALHTNNEQVLVMEGELPLMQASLEVAPAKIQLETEFSEATTYTGSASNLDQKVREFLCQQLSRQFKLEPKQIDPAVALEHYGIDSILAINLTNQLEESFGVLSKTLFFEYQNVNELVEYFIDSHADRVVEMFADTADEELQVKAPERSAQSNSSAPTLPNDSSKHRYLSDKEPSGVNQNSANQATTSGRIAIVGLSGRYPQSRNISEFWDNLKEGRDCIEEVPLDRWDWKEYFSEDRTREGHHYSKWGGFIKGMDEFDPLFFNISPREAKLIDPQERVFLQHAWMAVEDAGLTRDSLQSSVEEQGGQAGVYVGVMYGEYQLLGIESSLQGKRTGFASNLASIANRVSYVLNLHGPSMTLDTMCSSSLTSIHLACQDLKHGQINLAIAGGVNLSVHANKYLMLSAGQFISSDGRCQSFGEGGDGYIPAEGVGAVVLKRLEDAERDGHHIYGVIRGTALSHGGKTNGYTVPNPKAQANSIVHAVKGAKVNPRHISYIEAHGTGTNLGDPIEVAGLNRAFRSFTKDTQFCSLGSAKSNIGHCESAAGIAGLTKVLLQMKHQKIVPSLHSEKLNPHINFSDSPFTVNQKLKPWSRPVYQGQVLPRIAGVSSFGAGGSNAHLIVEEYTGSLSAEARAFIDQPEDQAIVLSARTEPQLIEIARALLDYIASNTTIPSPASDDNSSTETLSLASIAYTLQIGREAMQERLAFVVNSLQQLETQLKEYLAGRKNKGSFYQGNVKSGKEKVAEYQLGGDSHGAISDWLDTKSLSKLVDAWANGLAIDWRPLYVGAKPVRVSLPTYPFATDRYWIDLPTAPNVAGAHNSTVLHPFVHENTSNMNQLAFSSRFTGKESFLTDLSTNTAGSVLQFNLPFSVYLEMARFCVEQAMPAGSQYNCLELHESSMATNIQCDVNHSINVALINANNSSVNVEVFSSSDEDTVHFQAHVQVKTIEIPKPVNVQLLGSESDSTVIDSKSFYARLKNAKQPIGQATGVVESVRIGKNELVARLNVEKALLKHSTEPYLRPDILENCFLTAGILASNLTGVEPGQLRATSIGVLRLLSPFRGCTYSHAQVSNLAEGLEGLTSLDIDIYNQNGQMCMQLVSVQYNRVSSENPELAPKTDAAPELITLKNTIPNEPEPIPVPVSLRTDRRGNKEPHFSEVVSVKSIRSKPGNISLVALEAASFVVEKISRIEATSKVQLSTLEDASIQLPVDATDGQTVSVFDEGMGQYSIHMHSTDDANELNASLIRSLISAIKHVRERDDLKVMVMRGTSVAFLTGNAEHHNDAIKQELYKAIVDFPYPTIAVAQGNALGAGFMVAALCDLMVCSESARFGFCDVDLQLFSSAQEQTLFATRFGSAIAHDFLYIDTVANGQALKNKGWSCPIESSGNVEPRAGELASKFTTMPRKALRLLKQHLARTLVEEVNELLPVEFRQQFEKMNSSDHDEIFQTEGELSNHDGLSVLTSTSTISVDIDPEQSAVVMLGISEHATNLSELYKDLRLMFEQLQLTGAYKAVVLHSQQPMFFPIGALNSDVQTQHPDHLVQALAHLLATSPIPVVAAFTGSVDGAAWYIGQHCDACIYNEQGIYSAGTLLNHALLLESAQHIFTKRLGNNFGSEVLLTGAQFTGTTLQQRCKTAHVSAAGNVIEQALSIAKRWARWPHEVLGHWQQQRIEALQADKLLDNKEVKSAESDEYLSHTNGSDGVDRSAIQTQTGAGYTLSLESNVIHATVHDHGVIVIEMKDQQAKNMFSHAFIDGLNEVFTKIEQSTDYRAVVMHGYDTYFASGGTRESLIAIQEGVAKFTDTRVYDLAMQCKLPVIAAMQGHGIGAGWALGMFADVVIFSEESQYVSPYMGYGFTPGAGSTLVFPHKIGYDLARETLLTAQPYTGLTLQQRGLATQIVPRRQVVTQALELAQQIAQQPHAAVRAIKQKLTSDINSALEATYALELAMHEETFVGQSSTRQKIDETFMPSLQAGTEHQVTSQVTIASAETHPETVPAMSVPSAPALVDIRDELKRLLAEELHMKLSDISEDMQFIDLGLDSITGVTWVRNINELYQLKIEATKVYSYPTIDELTAYTYECVLEQHAEINVSVDQEPSKPAPVQTSAVAVSKQFSLVAIARKLKETLATELHMDEQDIDDTVQFIDIGLDSITGVTWTRSINEIYGLALEATKMYSYPTIEALGGHVMHLLESLSPKQLVQADGSDTVAQQPVPFRGNVTPTELHQQQLVSWRHQSQTKTTEITHATQRSDIAVIGMAGKFPDASNLQEYWDNIANSKDCIHEVPAHRWDINAYYTQGDTVAGKTNCKWMGALVDYDLFDPLFFNISPVEAESMDPQQRHFLQSCWHSLEDAGYNPFDLSGVKCGVFAGCANGDYHRLGDSEHLTAQGFTGGALSILAARIAYFLNLQGPCLSIDTACSSSLVAVANACDSLRAGTSDLALAGGVYIMSGPEIHIKTAQTGMLSTEGKCFSFDERANGFVPGEGVGVVLLKRLEDATTDHDIIHGVISGWGINQDGKTNGITAPNPDSQSRLQKDVYTTHNIHPATIQLVEAHGTGTKLGDPIEIEALQATFKQYTEKKEFCALGSVKSNIGHCVNAAGVAGLIKVLLAIKHKKLPPTINFERLNEHISLENSPFYINRSLQDWNVAPGQSRRAAVSSFGFSGTNAHVVVSEHSESDQLNEAVVVTKDNDMLVFPLSAKTDAALKQGANKLLNYLQSLNSVVDEKRTLLSVSYTLQIGRAPMEARLAFVASTRDQLIAKLQAYLEGEANIDYMYQGDVSQTREQLRLISGDQELTDTLISKWVREANISRMADVWVKGLNIDWNVLYGKTKPKRINLPTYSFEQERYWLEEAPTINGGHSTEQLHPLLHSNNSDLLQQKFISTFTGQEHFLNDHKLSGDGLSDQKVLPGVAYLEMARKAVERSLPSKRSPEAIELRNIVWIQPILVNTPVEVEISLNVRDLDHSKRDVIDFVVYTRMGEETLVHCEGQALHSTNSTPLKLDLTVLAEKMTQRTLQSETVYSTFKQMGVDYGPAHRGVEHIRCGDNELLATVRLPEVVAATQSDYVLHPSLIDSALQVTIGFIDDLNHIPGNPNLPFAMEYLKIYSQCPDTVMVWVRQTDTMDSSEVLTKFDLDIIDMQGNVCVEIRGFSTRALGNEKSEASSMIRLAVEDVDNKSGTVTYDESFYKKVIESVVNNELTADEAAGLG